MDFRCWSARVSKPAIRCSTSPLMALPIHLQIDVNGLNLIAGTNCTNIPTTNNTKDQCSRHQSKICLPCMGIIPFFAQCHGRYAHAEDFLRQSQQNTRLKPTRSTSCSARHAIHSETWRRIQGSFPWKAAPPCRSWWNHLGGYSPCRKCIG